MHRSPAQLRKAGLPVWKQLIVSGLYTGLSPLASGTIASALAATVYFLPFGTNLWFLLGISAAAYGVGIPLSRDAEKVLGHDPSYVTIDEFAGQWLAMASPFLFVHDPTWAVLTFLMFRIFDIAKVWPASYFDSLRGGFGIMTDDIAAAVYANLLSHLLWFGVIGVRQYFGI